MASTAYIAIRDDSLPGSGTMSAPFNGPTDQLLDTTLASLPSETMIEFGPGVFRTKGFGAVTPGWRLKSGQKVIGSSMHTTVLQLVGATAPAGGDSSKVA